MKLERFFGVYRLLQTVAKLCAIPIWLSLTGCTSLSQIQEPLSKFDQGVHAVATAQVTFMNSAHSVECEKQFYDDASDFISRPGVGINLQKKCDAAKVSLTSAQIKVRQSLLDALTLYADKLQAIGDGSDDKALDDKSQTVATNLNKIASDHELSSADLTVTQDAEAAVVGIASMVLDQRKFSDITSAAKAQQSNIELLARTLQQENIAIAYVVDGDVGAIRNKMQIALRDMRDKQGSTMFVDLITARNYLLTITPFGSKGLDSSAEDSNDIDPASAVKQLNDALDGLVSANRAIATPGKGSIRATVSDFAEHAQTARAFKTAISK